MAYYWQTQLERFKKAYSENRPESWFISAIENSREMKTTYQSLKRVSDFIEWLEYKAMIEAEGHESSGGVFLSIGGSA